MKKLAILTGALLIQLLCASSFANAEDWPQWRGVNRDGVWNESDIIEAMPVSDLPLRWSVPIAYGYSGPAVADGKVFLFEYEKRSGEITNNPGGKDALEGAERLRCLDAKSGQEIWSKQYDRPYLVSYPGGPRCTPTVDGERVYTLGTEGDLKCWQVSDGEELWSVSFAEDFGAETPLWGHSAHPLVDDDNVYCIVGGEGSIAVALDKKTGKEKWRKLTSVEPGYCPPMMMEIQGKKRLIIFHPAAVNGLDPASGEVIWSVPIESAYGMSIVQPLLAGDRILASGFRASVCFAVPNGNEEPAIYWAGSPKTSVSSANSTPIYDGKAIYGVDADSSQLVAINPETGERYWETKAPTVGLEGRGRHGTAFIVRQGDSNHYWIMSELGDLILAQLTPKSYKEIGRKKILEPTGIAFNRPVLWSHPAFADGAVFARNDKELVCLELTDSE